MLAAIKNFFEQKIALEKPIDEEHELKLATASLLIEMMQQDDQCHEDEIKAIKSSLFQKFDLTRDETELLYSLAEQEAKNATDYHQFTTLIAKGFTREQKIKVIKYLWVVAYADDHLDSYEELMVRRIADLIYVSHKDYLKAKHDVLKEIT